MGAKNGEYMEYNLSGKEYYDGESWIKSVIDGLDCKYNKLQKMAVIHHAIGKRISYSPDFHTAQCDENDCRNIYRIINSRLWRVFRRSFIRAEYV